MAVKKSWRPIADLPNNLARAILWFEPRLDGRKRIEGHMIMAWRQAGGWSMDRQGRHPIDKAPTFWRYVPSPPPERRTVAELLDAAESATNSAPPHS